MKQTKVIIIALLLLAINSCKEEDKANPVENPDPREYTPEIIQEEYGSARVVGFVVDKAGNPLDGVRVHFGEHESITDGEGKFELSEVSAGSGKRIWFEKEGYARTQKLVDVREDLPNRADAALFQIAKSEKMTDAGGLIETEDFTVDIQSGGFVYSDGEIVEGEVIVSVTPFLNSEENFIDAFPGDFEGRREDGTTTPIESFGFIDVDLRDEAGEPVQMADGVTATIKIKAPENAPATIPMWWYDYQKSEWIEEGTGSLDNGFYTAVVNHFTPWNWDVPLPNPPQPSTIIGRVVDNGGNPIEGARIIQTGINRTFQESTKSEEDGTFEMFTLENMELELEAQFDIYGSTNLNKTTSSNQTEINDLGDIIIDVSLENVLYPEFNADTVIINTDREATIRGRYFGKEKRDSFRLLLNDQEIEPSSWSSDEVKFIAPSKIPEFGTLQIDRDGYKSSIIIYRVLFPEINQDTLLLLTKEEITVQGKYFDEERKDDFSLLLNGNDIEPRFWSDEEIKFVVPSKLPEIGTLQIDRDGDKSNIVTYKVLYPEIQSDTIYIIPDEDIIIEGNHFGTEKFEGFSLLLNDEEIETSLWSSEEIRFIAPRDKEDLGILKIDKDGDESNMVPYKVLYPVIDIDTVLIMIGEKISIGGINYGSQKQNDYKLLLNGTEIETSSWSNNQVQFEVPNNISEFGTFQIDRGGYKSNIIQYVEGEWTCLVGGLLRDNRLLKKNASNGIMISMYDRGLSELPDCIGNLKKVEHLYVEKNSLTTLPESIGSLSSLKTLDLSKNIIKILPESVGNLSSLEKLDLRENKLENLPESIGDLSLLNELELSDNKLSSIPESIGDLSSLTYLGLRDNQLTTLPESIGDLSSLTNLSLGFNNLESLPESLGDLSSLTNLILGLNNLDSLPESLGNLTSLTGIDLSSNNLKRLPVSIRNLDLLEILNLRNNKIESLPESIGSLTALTELILDNNELSKLPELIGNFNSLEFLLLSNNKIESLPESIKNLSNNLKELDISGNPISGLEKAKIEAWLPNTNITW